MSLHNLIRDIAADNTDASTHKIARLVAENTDQADMFDFYVSALERLVSDVIRTDRNATLNSKQRRSPKLEDRRNWWARMLTERVSIGQGRYKSLADCSIDDLLNCISVRHDQIGALQGQIIKYQAIVEAMRTHGVELVAELPEGAVEL